MIERTVKSEEELEKTDLGEFNDAMYNYCGKKMKLNKISNEAFDYIQEDSIFLWKEEWLVPIEEDTDTQEKQPVKSDYTDTHYDFKYNLTQEDIDRGYIKIDPYFIGNEWKVGEKDPSGILTHNLKTIARFGDKNSKRRESEALVKQSENLLRFY